MDLLFTRPPSRGLIDVVILDEALKAACDNVVAISVAQHCDPYAIVVYLNGEATTEERQIIEDVIEQHQGGTLNDIAYDGRF